MFDHPHDDNSSGLMFEHHSAIGYDKFGNGITLAMFSSFANCRPSNTFLSAAETRVLTTEDTSRPFHGNNALDTEDSRIFLHYRRSDYHLFEVASKPGHFLTCGDRGQVIVKYIRGRQRYRDESIKFRMEYPDSCNVLEHLSETISPN